MAGIDRPGRVVVAGAGLAGLVAAERLSAAGWPVLMLEASSKAGGRCRSYHDERLGCLVDNGNHLILSANRHVLRWSARIGGAGSLQIAEAAFPFLDLRSGARFELRLGDGPLGALRRSARPPGVTLLQMLTQMAGLVRARRGTTVAQVVQDRGALWHLFWDPMTRAILNSPPDMADAGLLRTTMLRSLARGARSSRPVLATGGLGPALIDPALDMLARRGVDMRLRTPVRAIHLDGDQNGGRAVRLVAGREVIEIGPRDHLVLALPPQVVAGLLPDLSMPHPGMAIVNAHFRVPGARLPPILALIGGAAQWLFRRGDVVSVTVSAAEESVLPGLSRDAVLDRLWTDVALALQAHGGPVPAQRPLGRLLQERAATFAQSPAGVAVRHATRTRWRNITLAGDHVDTGLPATLEGAVISGERAALAVARGRALGWRR